MILSDIVH